MSREEMARRGWDALDVLLVTGDAYVDHPSFGTAMLGRWLEANGYRVGIVAQPRWDTPSEVLELGRPKLFAGVTAGALDSMLAHYTAFRKKRSDDAYTPGGRAGARPNRATIVYTNLVRQAFPGLPVVIGGIEASLRRATHYDFWTDKVRRSILLDSKADLLIYGMAERAIIETARRLEATSGDEIHAEALWGIPGTAFAASSLSRACEAPDGPPDTDVVVLPSHEAIAADPKELMTATLAIERQVRQAAQWAVQANGARQVVFTPPARPLDTAELDALYALPFTRRAHPSYTEPIPAADMIQFSITSHRGCAAGCTFCSIAMHQGRRLRSRSAESLEREVLTLTRHPDWAGSISDVGGPTANMWGARCRANPEACQREDCLWPDICAHFEMDEAAQV
ncbi:MAG TPA: YgiQ family radical SAM protein, partial [Candidatus Hydrogenedentes bacterium]|nr:YgiQ family radical SAM protein [Candidatus Hydrogenedentota bacterium]